MWDVTVQECGDGDTIHVCYVFECPDALGTGPALDVNHEHFGVIPHGPGVCREAEIARIVGDGIVAFVQHEVAETVRRPNGRTWLDPHPGPGKHPHWSLRAIPECPDYTQPTGWQHFRPWREVLRQAKEGGE